MQLNRFGDRRLGTTRYGPIRCFFAVFSANGRFGNLGSLLRSRLNPQPAAWAVDAAKGTLRSLRRAAIATGSICVMSPNRRVSCAAASPPIPMTFTQPLALGRKFVVPLCRGHHRAVHRARDERAWWRQAAIDPIKVARRLWKETRGLGQRRSSRPAAPRQHAAAASSDSSPEKEETCAPATSQEGARSPDLSVAGPDRLDA
jgi:hypothetical protein